MNSLFSFAFVCPAMACASSRMAGAACGVASAICERSQGIMLAGMAAREPEGWNLQAQVAIGRDRTRDEPDRILVPHGRSDRATSHTAASLPWLPGCGFALAQADRAGSGFKRDLGATDDGLRCPR